MRWSTLSFVLAVLLEWMLQSNWRPCLESMLQSNWRPCLESMIKTANSKIWKLKLKLKIWLTCRREVIIIQVICTPHWPHSALVPWFPKAKIWFSVITKKVISWALIFSNWKSQNTNHNSQITKLKHWNFFFVKISQKALRRFVSELKTQTELIWSRACLYIGLESK
jgi:hypothetical protein